MTEKYTATDGCMLSRLKKKKSTLVGLGGWTGLGGGGGGAGRGIVRHHIVINCVDTNA